MIEITPLGESLFRRAGLLNRGNTHNIVGMPFIFYFWCRDLLRPDGCFCSSGEALKWFSKSIVGVRYRVVYQVKKIIKIRCPPGSDRC